MERYDRIIWPFVPQKEDLVKDKVLFVLGGSPNDRPTEGLQDVIPHVFSADDSIEPCRDLYAVAEALQA